MKKIKYNQPYKVSKTDSQKEYLPTDYKKYYSTHYSIITKYGIVLMTEMDWETNTQPSIFTYLMTVVNGKVHSAFLEKSKLSEIFRKRIATQFIKNILKKKGTKNKR